MRPAARYVETALAIVALAVVALAITWRATGGGFYAVQTASMGTAAPVGTLVIDRPTARSRVGELITFRVPGSGKIFTHRVIGFAPDGGIRTKGDINSAPDSWVLRHGDVLGHVVATVPYVGWLLRAMPILAIGIVIVWLLTRTLVVPEWRATARASGLLAVAVVAITLLSPLIGSAVITFARGQNGAAAAVVSTGVLPLNVTAVGGTSQTITDGQVAHVVTTRLGAHHQYQLRVTPDFEWWWILPLSLLTLLPAFVSLTVAEPEHALETDLPILALPELLFPAPPALPEPVVHAPLVVPARPLRVVRTRAAVATLAAPASLAPEPIVPREPVTAPEPIVPWEPVTAPEPIAPLALPERVAPSLPPPHPTSVAPPGWQEPPRILGSTPAPRRQRRTWGLSVGGQR